MTKREPMQSVTRAIQVLKAFSISEKELSLTELSDKLEISISSVQRILTTLTGEGFLEKDERKKTYKLGMELYFLGNLVEGNSHLLSITKKYMKQLNDETGETITLNIVHNNKRKCIAYSLAKHELTTLSYISKESPLYAGASAKVLLANLPEAIRESYINELELELLTANTVKSKEELCNQLKVIREQGYEITKNERILGVYAVSAPIRNRLNEVIASLTITIPTIRVDETLEKKYVEWVVGCTKRISQEFGGG